MDNIDPDFDIELKLLLEGIYLKYQHDFRQYGVASMRRRMHGAMAHFGCATLSQLQDRVLHEPAVFQGMMRFFTVQVSEMFRDPGYFAALRQHVLPELSTHPTFKIWVAGCATGEEAWSLAILLDEAGLLERSLIYATDISPEALRTAAAGIYGLDSMAQFSSNYLNAGGTSSLSDYFTTGYGGAIVDQRLKQHVVFSDHSLATDQVFSEVHFVSCRNVLIYFNRQLQDRAIGLFHEALVHRGYLGLGSRESLRLTSHAGHFREVAGAERLYQRL